MSEPVSNPYTLPEPASLVLDERGCELWRADWRQLAERARELGGVDAVIVDAPYSERTHAGHGSMARGAVADVSERRDLDYGSWTPADVRAFVEAWAPVNRGWWVSLTDDDLAAAWKTEFRRAGLTTFAAVPAVIRGMTVRMSGDGPSSWTIQCIVARPKALSRWGTLDGAHVGPSERQPVVGGKPEWLMRALVRDYSRPNDLVCDPCAGGFTTAVACIAEGRRFLGGDIDPKHVDIGVERVRSLPQADRKGTLALRWR